MNSKLREIAGKPAGTYFIVTDNSAVPNIEEIGKLRLFFINTEKGPVNTMVIFKKGDTSSFTNIFGKRSRQSEKRGNYSIQSCISGLTGGPIAVVNLRKFSEIDTIGVIGIDASAKLAASVGLEYHDDVPYTEVFNINSFWTIQPKNIEGALNTEHLLNFANIGSSNSSIFVVASQLADTKTSESKLSLANCSLDIDEYPGLNFEMQLKNTFVDVYIFNNTFDVSSSTNKYYGHLFDGVGTIAYSDLTKLSLIPESGFDRVVTGSMIPMLKNELGESISIDDVMNTLFAETGIICHINDDILEYDNKELIDLDCSSYYDSEGLLIVGKTSNMLSHAIPKILTHSRTTYLPAREQIKLYQEDMVEFLTKKVSDTEFLGVYEQGIRVGDKIKGINGTTVEVTGIEILKENVPAEVIPAT